MFEHLEVGEVYISAAEGSIQINTLNFDKDSTIMSYYGDVSV